MAKVPTVIDHELLRTIYGNAKADSILQRDIKTQLRVKDEQLAVNRIINNNLPKGLKHKSRLIEKILYYKGQAIIFRIKIEDEYKYLVLPYAPSGGLDCYGRFKKCVPLPFSGTGEPKDKEDAWIPGFELNAIYDIDEIDELTEEQKDSACVIISDYTTQRSQKVIPRAQLNDSLLDVESSCIPYMNTALVNSTGVQGIKIPTQDQSASVYDASNSMNVAALCGQKFIPIVGGIEMQELTGGNTGKSSEFMQAFQSLENYRVALYGVESGGVYEKKAHMLEDEQESNKLNSNFIMADCLDCRNEAWEIANKLWGINISAEEVKFEDTEEEDAVSEDEDMIQTEEVEEEQEVSE